jgi:hypothetical protein
MIMRESMKHGRVVLSDVLMREKRRSGRLIMHLSELLSSDAGRQAPLQHLFGTVLSSFMEDIQLSLLQHALAKLWYGARA